MTVMIGINVQFSAMALVGYSDCQEGYIVKDLILKATYTDV